MKIPVDPSLPAEVGLMRSRLTTLLRSIALEVNSLIDRTSTPVAASAAATVGASPYSFSSITQDGLLVVTGGTVSQIAYGRRGVFIALGITAGLVPVKSGDVVRITYTVAPTVAFIPQ